MVKTGGLSVKEVTRSNDPVFLSRLVARLSDDAIPAVVLNRFGSSVMHACNATALQRVMVDEPDYWAARAVVIEAEDGLTEDGLLDGRVRFLQPLDGFRDQGKSISPNTEIYV